MLPPSMHSIRIAHVCIELLLLLLIKRATEIGTVVAIIWLGGHILLSNCIYDHATGALVVHVSLVVLINHLIKKIIVDQISFARWVLLVDGDGGGDVFAFEAYWRRIQTIIVVHLTRKFWSEWRLLDGFVVAVLLINFMISISTLPILKHFQWIISTRSANICTLSDAISFVEGTETCCCNIVCLLHTINNCRWSKLILAVFAHSHIKPIQIFILLVSGFKIVAAADVRVQGAADFASLIRTILRPNSTLNLRYGSWLELWLGGEAELGGDHRKPLRRIYRAPNIISLAWGGVF